MSLKANFLSQFPVMRVSDPKVAEERLRLHFGATRVRVTQAEDDFLFHANDLKLATLGISFVATSGKVVANFPAASFVRQLFIIEGHGNLTHGRLSEPLIPGLWSSVLPAGEKGTISFGPDYSQLSLRIERAALYAHLKALIGDQMTRDLEFVPRTVDNSAMHSLRIRVFQFATDYNARGIYFSPIAIAEVERMLIMKFLMCHRHTYTNLLLREPIPATGAAVRLVAEYLEAHWDQPLDTAKLAEVADVSVRSLFRQFQKERGQSPLEFIKDVRLQKSLLILENPDVDTTVTQVSLRCGFNSGGRFAREYQLKFGELPSKTLARARNQ